MLEPVRSIPDDVPPRSRTLGWAILEWTANWLEQPDGPSAGERWRYTPEQMRTLCRWYEIDEHGKFIFRRGVYRRMKGAGKTPFLASLACVELCGPCRFGGWDEEGLPIAIPHPSPWVQCAAVNLSQTRNLMLLLPSMFSKDAISEFNLDLGKEIVYAGNGGQIQAVTSSPKSLEGNRATAIICDETHLWLDNNQGKEMMQVIKRNLAKARDGEARVMEITNAHRPAEDSAAEETYEAWRTGRLPDVYYDALQAPRVEDLRDREKLREALVICRGDADWLDLDRLVAEVADATVPEYVSRRYYLNEIADTDGERWLPLHLWDACALPGQEIAPGATVVLGFDGSRTGDACALVAVSVVAPDEPHHVEVAALHENTERDPDYEVPMETVMDSIRSACQKWKVREVACDFTWWALPLQTLRDEGLPIVAMPQSLARMAPAQAAFRQAVVSGHITHNGDPDLRRHVGNAILIPSSKGDKLAKPSKNSPHKIDLAVAATMAFARASEHKPKRPRIFSLNQALADAQLITNENG